ncbi:MAG: energy transducer TonB [Bacteroidaceae bacterium]|nr:energy transducer TonB [Bacteroidaceae bacterium]
MMFIFKSAIVLTLLYSCYVVFLSRDTYHRFNRVVLIAITLLSLILPAFRISTQQPQAVHRALHEIEVEMTEGVVLDTYEPSIIAYSAETEVKEHTGVPSFFLVVRAIYFMGLLVVFLRLVKCLVNTVRQMRGGLRLKDGQGNTVVVKAGDFAPFSFLRWIVININDYERNRESILKHEQAHIRFFHSYDILLLQFVKLLQWFNPFIYFLERDLKAVHEYMADEAVIHQGIDAQTYQLLLVSKAVGGRLQTLANNFNHSLLKSRILMMKKKPTPKAAALKSLCLLPVVVFSITTFAKIIPADALEEAPADNHEFTSAKIESSETAQPLVEEQIPIPEAEAEVPTTTDQPKPFTLHLVVDQYGRILGFSHEGEPPASHPQVFPVGYIFIDGREATLEEAMNYKSYEPFEIIKNPQGSEKWNFKDKQGIVNFKTNQDDVVFTICEEMPQFPGGDVEMMKFIAMNIKYPKEASEKGVQGRVLVQFIVEKDGRLTSPTVAKITGFDDVPCDTAIVVNAYNMSEQERKEFEAQNADLEAGAQALKDEAIRVVKLMPNWLPGKQRGKAVRVKHTIPIMYRLQ